MAKKGAGGSDPLDVCKTVAIFFQKSRCQLAKNAVEGSDPLDVCKIVVFFLHLAKANHHAPMQKRLWKSRIPSVFPKSRCIFCVRRTRITTPTRQKGCGKTRSAPRFQNGVAFFASGENGSPRSRAKKAVGKSDPLAFLKSGGIFLQSAKTDHHSDVTKRLWENGSPRVSWHIASFFGHSPRFFRSDFDAPKCSSPRRM